MKRSMGDRAKGFAAGTYKAVSEALERLIPQGASEVASGLYTGSGFVQYGASPPEEQTEKTIHNLPTRAEREDQVQGQSVEPQTDTPAQQPDAKAERREALKDVATERAPQKENSRGMSR